ncbi:MAG TPA: tetraacyldisaccharide 4'-kinase, partial [Pyrinomonadaceae bacterium]|nr:tetraacyldisaccharide 4'-kinase [Pyrinomonadaceae bacterium]
LCAPHTPVLTARLRTLRARPVLTPANAGQPDAPDDGAARAPAGSLKETLPEPFAAFCALGNPQAFFAHLGRDGLTPVHTRAFPDHHAYTQRDLDALTRDARRHGARALLTTAKDAVKLRALDFALPCFALDVALEVDDAERLLALVRRAIGR